MKARTPRGLDARNHLLDIAEKLFAENGPAAVTVRTIAAAAAVNTQSVNYYFGSKDRLFEEMFARRVGPINRQRLELLDACLRGVQAPLLEDVVDAFVSPILRLRQEPFGHQRALVVMQFQARAVASPGESEFAYLKLHFEPLRSRFMSAFSAALPQLAIEDVVWRYNFMCGAILYSMAGPLRMLHPPESMANAPLREAGDEAAAIRHLVRFLCGGFRAGSLFGEWRQSGDTGRATAARIRNKSR